MILKDTIEQVAAAADIGAIIGEFTPLKGRGRQLRGPCPLHGGKNPNLSVSRDKGVFYCFVCQEKGNVFQFLEKQLGISWEDAVRFVGERVGIEVKSVDRISSEPDPREPERRSCRQRVSWRRRPAATQTRGLSRGRQLRQCRGAGTRTSSRCRTRRRSLTGADPIGGSCPKRPSRRDVSSALGSSSRPPEVRTAPRVRGSGRRARACLTLAG